MSLLLLSFRRSRASAVTSLLLMTASPAPAQPSAPAATADSADERDPEGTGVQPDLEHTGLRPAPAPNRSEGEARAAGSSSQMPPPGIQASERHDASDLDPSLRSNAETAAPPVSPAQNAPPDQRIATHELDRVLSEAANDLGLEVQRVSPTTFGDELDYTAWEVGLGTPAPGHVNMGTILERSQGQWFARIVLAFPDGTFRSVRTTVTEANYEVPLIKALRQLTPRAAAPQSAAVSPAALPHANSERHSEGRPILAANGALLGGYVGFTLENAGGVAETRLVYPLIALGAGVGLAASLIVADEWDVTRADAWYVSAASTWLTAGAILVANDLDLRHATDRYSYGLIGTAAGLGVSGIVISQREVTDAESLFAHSGGLLGVVMGGLTQRLLEPTSSEMPGLGMGLGATAGVLIAGVGGAALLPDLSSSRVLFADLGALLGGLAGAAVATPALVGKQPPDARDERIFVGSALAGLTLGAVLGYWLGPDTDVDAASHGPPPVGLHIAPGGARTPTPGYSLEPELPTATTIRLHGQW